MTPEERQAQRHLTGLLHSTARLSEDGGEVRIWRDPRDDGETMMSVEEVTNVLEVLGISYMVAIGVPRPKPFGRRFSARGVEVRAASADVAKWSPALRTTLAVRNA